ncbi:GTPase IMAP family member 4-like isoform X2 [Clupea harengus]|uniref:GTPase IMAP family member 4-like isoform X2 n=1 Tax=Clupea harengus TaxID=7950 RepID=A0A6P8EWS8_CLUHA|nr:GTPase IMAP family member 4-like isoform X2 [Clupea harengus]
MECDCRPDSPCTTSSNCGDESNIEASVKGLWINANTLLTGLISVAGFLLFRCSQALPGWFSWPIRIICSLTGISSVWSWLTNLVKAVRGLQTLFKWLGRLWHFLVGVLISIKQGLEFVVNLKQHVKGPFKNKKAQARQSRSPPPDQGLRLIVVGPQGKTRNSLVSILHGSGTSLTHEDTQKCKRWRTEIDGREVTVVETPDLLGKTLEPAQRAREALRSLQKASPGPHAFLLALHCPGTTAGDCSDAANALHALVELVGEGALSHVLVVLLTETEGRGRARSLSQLLEEDAGSLRETLSMCGQRAELVDGSQESDGGDAVPRLLERVVEMRALQGHYVHELQRREERIRQELLADMAHVLTQKLEGNWG